MTDSPQRQEGLPGTAASPVREADRVESVDFLRGAALFGILIINISAFAVPEAVIDNPRLWGRESSLDFATWVFTHVFVFGKFITIFSMLFGAGLILMNQRVARKARDFARIYYRRIFWLMIIGSLHGYLLWWGDILFNYGTCGLFLFVARDWSPRRLLSFGLLMISLSSLPIVALGFHAEFLRSSAESIEAMASSGVALSPADEETLREWRELKDDIEPGQEKIAEMLQIYRGTYIDILRYRAPKFLEHQIALNLFYLFWLLGGVMLLGMALMKWRIFASQRSAGFYLRCLWLGYGLGLPMTSYAAWDLVAHDFDQVHHMKLAFHINSFGNILVALGHIALAMLIYRSVPLTKIKSSLAAVGRMALSNYLLHSIVFTTLFYGYGFGLFGKVSRFEQMGFVVAMWVAQMILSPLWLRRFRFGPAEWAWRCLTYGHWERLRRAKALPGAGM